MGAVISLIVFAIGAIFRFATNVQSSTFNIRTIGDILMIVGVIGFVLAALSWAYWDGFGWPGGARRTRSTVVRKPAEPVYGPNGYARTTYEPAGYSRSAYDGTAYDGTGRAVSTWGPAAPLHLTPSADPTRPYRTVIQEEERSIY
jgi:hypothetical protein